MESGNARRTEPPLPRMPLLCWGTPAINTPVIHLQHTCLLIVFLVGRDVSPCPGPCGTVVERSLFFQFSFRVKTSEAIPIVLKTVLSVLDVCRGVQSSTAKFAIIIRLIARSIGFESAIC